MLLSPQDCVLLLSAMPKMGMPQAALLQVRVEGWRQTGSLVRDTAGQEPMSPVASMTPCSGTDGSGPLHTIPTHTGAEGHGCCSQGHTGMLGLWCPQDGSGQSSQVTLPVQSLHV